MDSPPNYPVIVVHTDDGDGLTACTGQPMPGPAGDVYRNVPRYFCQACARVNVYEEGGVMDSVQFLSNIARTEWVSGSKMQEAVNQMLSQGWTLLAAGVDPYGEPTWLLGFSYEAQREE